MITTFFPISLPRLPGVGRVIDHICHHAVGTSMVITIDGKATLAMVMSMKYTNGGFEIVTEI